MATRPAGKAGHAYDADDDPNGWYHANPDFLKQQLRGFMADVPASIQEKSLPIAGARCIIAPHAGYRYSGPCAAWAYKSLDLSRAKRVFVLGPSHTYYLEGCAATSFGKYATPFGDLTVDTQTVRQIKDAARMPVMPVRNETKEHSLEMHMPYLHLRCQETFGSADQFPSIVPLLVGTTSLSQEKEVGRVLLPYLKDPENAFIVSSDFCHWGENFSYTAYAEGGDLSSLVMLGESEPAPSNPPIHEVIKLVDDEAMEAVESGSHEAFCRNIKKTGNTVCGRHPIGVMMAALELLRKQPGFEDKGRFDVINYDRSNLVTRPDDFSVSYVSAYATA